MSAPSLLIVAAAGRTGVELIRASASSPHTPSVHAFLRTPSKLSPSDTALCTSIVKGDACLASDVSRALSTTGADVVILVIGVPNSAAPTDLRESSARALLETLREDARRFEHVRVVVVSSVGAGGSKMDYGWGVGSFMSWVIRNVLRDHDNREKMFEEWMKTDEERNRERVWIVRPTMLTAGKPKGGVVVYGDGRAPSWWCDRKDLGEWIVKEVCEAGKGFGTAVNVTGKS